MRTRILLGTLVLMTLTIAAFFVPAALALDAAERSAQELELQREASDAAALLGARQGELEEGPRGDGEREGPTGAEDGPGEEETGEGEVDDDGPSGGAGERIAPADADEDHLFGLYGADGRLLLGIGPVRADDPVRSALDGRAATARIGERRVAAVPLPDGGALRATEPAEEADERARAAILGLALAALVAVALAVLASWLLAQRLTRPLRPLRRSAARLGGGDFTVAVDRTGVAEIDDLGDALATSASRIGALVERERRLTADTSHQMRTPLAGLRLALEAELAAPRPDPSEVLRESLGAVERLEATVAALTDLARDEEPGARVSVDDVAAAAADRWGDLLRRSGRELEVETGAGTVVAARRSAVDTIVDVLVDNALHHGRGAISVTAGSEGGSAWLSVADEGTCEVADDALFGRRLSTAGRTGIGLHLARSLAEAEGARLRLRRSAPTTFQLVLPAVSDPVEGHPTG